MKSMVAAEPSVTAVPLYMSPRSTHGIVLEPTVASCNVGSAVTRTYGATFRAYDASSLAAVSAVFVTEYATKPLPRTSRHERTKVVPPSSNVSSVSRAEASRCRTASAAMSSLASDSVPDFAATAPRTAAEAADIVPEPAYSSVAPEATVAESRSMSAAAGCVPSPHLCMRYACVCARSASVSSRQ